jgi:hypothetical protein
LDDLEKRGRAQVREKEERTLSLKTYREKVKWR